MQQFQARLSDVGDEVAQLTASSDGKGGVTADIAASLRDLQGECCARQFAAPGGSSRRTHAATKMPCTCVDCQTHACPAPTQGQPRQHSKRRQVRPESLPGPDGGPWPPRAPRTCLKPVNSKVAAGCHCPADAAGAVARPAVPAVGAHLPDSARGVALAAATVAQDTQRGRLGSASDCTQARHAAAAAAPLCVA